MTSNCKAFLSVGVLSIFAAFSTAGFVHPQTILRPEKIATSVTVLPAQRSKAETSSLLQEFCVASGEVINPYNVLKVSRQATREEIRSSYVTLSRRYHPDGFRQRTNILPGACNNVEEVRDQWERIKLAYEILSNAKTRRNYDRREVFADPGAAAQRAAVNAAVNSITGMGKGLFSIGAFAVSSLSKTSADVNRRSNDSLPGAIAATSGGDLAANCTSY